MALRKMTPFKRGEDLEPVSPRSQYWNSSALSVAIIGILEFETPLEVSRFMAFLENELLPINTRFSSIMVKDEKGQQQWKRVEVKLEEHAIFPVFPNGLSPECNEEYLQEYLSKIAMDPHPQGIPMWEVHIINYSTNNAAGTVVCKIHHSIGDGYSLMAALFSIFKRADNASLPLTMPASQSKHLQLGREMNIFRRLYSSLYVVCDSVVDFTWSLLKSTCLEDDHTSIRSATDGVELHHITISSVIFPLDRIKQVKTKLGTTVNDVICGIIFYGTQLYMHQQQRAGKASSITALVLVNTRMAKGYNYKDPKEMSKVSTEAPWGNHYGFYFVPLPCCNYNDVEKADPLGFVLHAKQMIEKKKKSLTIQLSAAMLEILRRFRGPQAAARYLHNTMSNSSMTISNMVGPIEKVVLAGQPLKSFYFMTVGMPPSLTITAVSYMGRLRVGVGAEKGFIDSPLLISCFEKAFARILEATSIESKM